MKSTDIEYELSQIACRNAIAYAARMLSAPWLHNAKSYVLLGADEVLHQPDESTLATDNEVVAYWRYRCCVDSGISYEDLTLWDCIEWQYHNSMSKDPEDCVTLEQVLAMTGLQLPPEAQGA